MVVSTGGSGGGGEGEILPSQLSLVSLEGASRAKAREAFQVDGEPATE